MCRSIKTVYTNLYKNSLLILTATLYTHHLACCATHRKRQQKGRFCDP